MQDYSIDLYLIIGLTRESRHWSEQFVQECENVFKPFSIHFIDLPGTGKLSSENSPWSISDIVDQAKKHTFFNPKNKKLLVAISLGGMVAWNWVGRYPNDFDAFIMLNSSLGGLSAPLKRVQPYAFLQFLNIGLFKKGPAREETILNLTCNNKALMQEILPKWVNLLKSHPISFRNTFAQFIAALKFNAKKAPKPLIPTYVIAAKHDRLAHYSCSEDIAHFIKAKLTIIEEKSIGHALHVDGQKILPKILFDWVSKLF